MRAGKAGLDLGGPEIGPESPGLDPQHDYTGASYMIHSQYGISRCVCLVGFRYFMPELREKNNTTYISFDQPRTTQQMASRFELIQGQPKTEDEGNDARIDKEKVQMICD